MPHANDMDLRFVFRENTTPFKPAYAVQGTMWPSRTAHTYIHGVG